MDTETDDAPVSERRIQSSGLKGRAAAIPIYLRVKARNLYLNQCLPFKAISQATGLGVEVLERLSCREGWTALRRAQKERLMKAADAGALAIESEIVQTVVTEGSELLLKTLQKTGEALERNDRDAAKDAQAYSATAKNLVSVVRSIRDNSGDGGDKVTGMELNLFFMGNQPTQEVKQVTEVEAVKTVSAQL